MRVSKWSVIAVVIAALALFAPIQYAVIAAFGALLLHIECMDRKPRKDAKKPNTDS